MPLVRLVRHGQASFGSDDYDNLSDLGRVQSRATGAELVRRGLRDPLVVSGTLRRQRDTATELLAAAGLEREVAVDGRLDEYELMEVVQRYTRPEDLEFDGSSKGLQPLLDAALAQWVAAGDADGWTAFSRGAQDAVAEVVAAVRKGQDALVVTSGGIIAAVCAGLLGAGGPAVVGLNRIAVNGAITTLLVGGTGTNLLSFNEHSHLSRDQVTYR